MKGSLANNVRICEAVPVIAKLLFFGVNLIFGVGRQQYFSKGSAILTNCSIALFKKHSERPCFSLAKIKMRDIASKATPSIISCAISVS